MVTDGLNDVQVWPTGNPVIAQDGNLNEQAYWIDNVVYFKIVESVGDWLQAHTDAINSAVESWNELQPTKIIPETLQLIYTPEEAIQISSIFENERQRLINQL